MGGDVPVSLLSKDGPWRFDELDDLPRSASRYEVVDGNLVVTPPPTDFHCLLRDDCNGRWGWASRSTGASKPTSSHGCTRSSYALGATSRSTVLRPTPWGTLGVTLEDLDIT
jgi:hypothetical protein